MTQPSLFASPDTVPTPIWLCSYERNCPRKGRAIWGQPQDRGDGVINTPIRCETCGKSGEQSVRASAEGA